MSCVQNIENRSLDEETKTKEIFFFFKKDTVGGLEGCKRKINQNQ